jgi:hypothetical protein
LQVSPTAREREQELRARLGVPDDAERVLIFGETSHWDPNWLQSSEEYYRRHIKGALDLVVDELVREPRRVFSVECVFFFRMYWEREAERRPALRRLVERGQLRFTGSGITTPDTLLPESEAILRDYLLGQQWLRDHGLDTEPRLAYLPDDFGHSPGLPSLLEALGYDQVCVTRIDGMYFVGCDYRLPSAYPLRGSSAALLRKELSTVDFVWRSPDGAEVLCHWNAFTYFQGDMLAHRGIMRWMDTMAVSWRTERYVAKQVERFAAQLAPLSPTPYLFCPIGCDFNGPIRDLVGLLDRYNARRYPESGVFAVNAAMEDYMDLVEPYRDELPVLDLDLNPYWMGFYGSRPQVKRVCKELTHKLLLGEQLAATRDDLRADALRSYLDAAWDVVAVSNHHDFITGTSPDRVYQSEQLPWLREAEKSADDALVALRPADAPAPSVRRRGRAGRSLPRWRQARGGVEITTQHYRLELSEDAGGCITSLQLGDGVELCEGACNDLVIYRDSGGLWRMGQEFFGGAFRPVALASRDPASIRCIERPGELEVRVESALGDRRFVRWLYLRDDCPTIRGRISGTAPRDTTVTCLFRTRLRADELAMDVPGGALSRPLRKLYDPTFWPARSWAQLRDRASDRGLAVLLSGPAAVSAPPEQKKDRQSGRLEWIVLRNATRERAFGVVPILAHPASGTDDERHLYDYAVVPTAHGDAHHNRLAQRARQAYLHDWIGEAAETTRGPLELIDAADTGSADGGEAGRDAMIVAVKRAHRGEGVIVRVERLTAGPTTVRLRPTPASGLRVLEANLCDARERHLRALELHQGEVQLPLPRTLATVRLLLD